MAAYLFIVCSLALLATFAHAMTTPVNKWLGVGTGNRAGIHPTNSIIDSKCASNRRANRALELFMGGTEVSLIACTCLSLHWSFRCISVPNSLSHLF